MCNEPVEHDLLLYQAHICPGNQKYLEFKIDEMAGLLKYFNRHNTQKKEKLDVLPGPLSRNIPSFSTGIANTCVRQ